MRIVPAPGRLVRDPETLRAISADGLTIDPDNLYWHRVLRDGDAVEAPETTEAPAASSAPAQEPAA